MLTYEYRIPMPMTCEEYHIAHLYMVAKASQEESGKDAGEGVEIVRNEPYDASSPANKHNMPAGQYTEKIFHLKSKLPRFVAMLMPDSMTDIIEYSWNAFPRYRTELHNAFFGEKVFLRVETMHVDDDGTTENAIGMDKATLSRRKVETLDIAADSSQVPMEAGENPCKFKSAATGRGPLRRNFAYTCRPVMTCYKVVTVQFRIFPVQSRVESWAQSYSRNTFIKYHRKLFCWMDEWFGLSISDIRKIESETAQITKDKIQASLQSSRHPTSGKYGANKSSKTSTN